MPIKIAFWNINTGQGSFRDRITTLQAWCQDMVPDLLLLEEVSHTLGPQLPTLTGMSEVCFANTRDKNTNPSTKQIWALEKINMPIHFEGRSGRLPGLKNAKRMGLKVQVKAKAMPGFILWAIHANSSARGGRAAKEAAEDYLEKNPGAVVGGDFNHPVAAAGNTARAPRSWQTNALQLTQWNKVGGVTSAPNAGLHLVTAPPVGPVLYTRVVPHRVIDYVMLGDDRTATAVRNCPNENMWKDILKSFDHCPVVYNLR